MIDITGLDKADVLQALYAFARPQGRGILHYRPGDLPRHEAVGLVSERTYFDYLHGRVLKADISGDALDPRLYDRDNGHGTARAAIDALLDRITAPKAGA